MWLKFLKGWNRIFFFYDQYITLASDMELYTDAASNFGFGGYYRGKYFSGAWPPQLPKLLDSEMSMAFRELYPIVVACLLWGSSMEQKTNFISL